MRKAMANNTRLLCELENKEKNIKLAKLATIVTKKTRYMQSYSRRPAANSKLFCSVEYVMQMTISTYTFVMNGKRTKLRHRFLRG